MKQLFDFKSSWSSAATTRSVERTELMGPGNFLQLLPNTFQVLDESLVISVALVGVGRA